MYAYRGSRSDRGGLFADTHLDEEISPISCSSYFIISGSSVKCVSSCPLDQPFYEPDKMCTAECTTGSFEKYGACVS